MFAWFVACATSWSNAVSCGEASSIKISGSQSATLPSGVLVCSLDGYRSFHAGNVWVCLFGFSMDKCLRAWVNGRMKLWCSGVHLLEIGRENFWKVLNVWFLNLCPEVRCVSSMPHGRYCMWAAAMQSINEVSAVFPVDCVWMQMEINMLLLVRRLFKVFGNRWMHCLRLHTREVGGHERHCL